MAVMELAHYFILLNHSLQDLITVLSFFS